MTDLTDKEQAAVRTALKFLAHAQGHWMALAKALPFDDKSLRATMRGTKDVSPTLVFRAARLAGASIDDLLAGRWLPSRTCQHCGAPPMDFVDEETVVEDVPRADGLKIVR